MIGTKERKGHCIKSCGMCDRFYEPKASPGPGQVWRVVMAGATGTVAQLQLLRLYRRAVLALQSTLLTFLFTHCRLGQTPG